MRARLATKITVLIVVVLIIGFGASTILTIQRESQLLVDQNKLAVRRLTATLVASIEGAMLQERPDVTRTVLDELKASSPVEELTIYRRNGVEAFTDLTTMMEVNKNAGLAKDVMDNIKKMVRAPGKTMAGGPDHLLDVVHDVLGQPGVLVDLHHRGEVGEGLDAVTAVDGELFHRR